MPDVDLDLLMELDRALASEGVHLRDFAAEHGVQYRLVTSLVADLGRRGYATEIWQDPADVGAFRHSSFAVNTGCALPRTS
jgi:hypothetical protein